MKTIPFECKVDNETLYCLANDWEKGKYRYSLELSRTVTPNNTILVVGVNPGGKTDPEKSYFGLTVRRLCNLVMGKDHDDKNHDSALLVNLTPVITLVPSSLKNYKIEPYHKKNIEVIKSLIQERHDRIHNVLFCFGSSFKYGKELFPEVIREITEELPSAQYWCFGLSREDYPIHPLARVGNMNMKKCKLELRTLCNFSYSTEIE